MCLLDRLEDSESSRSGTFGKLAMSVRYSLAAQRLVRCHSSDCLLTARDVHVVVDRGTKVPDRRQSSSRAAVTTGRLTALPNLLTPDLHHRNPSLPQEIIRLLLITWL